MENNNNRNHRILELPHINIAALLASWSIQWQNSHDRLTTILISLRPLPVLGSKCKMQIAFATMLFMLTIVSCTANPAPMGKATDSQSRQQWNTIRCVMEDPKPEAYCDYPASESTHLTPSLSQYRQLTTSMIVWWDEDKDAWQTSVTGPKASLQWNRFWDSLPNSNELANLKQKAKQFDRTVFSVMPKPSDVSSLPDDEFTNLIRGKSDSLQSRNQGEIFVFDEIIIPYIGTEPPRGYLRLSSKESLKLDALEFALRQEYWNIQAAIDHP